MGVRNFLGEFFRGTYIIVGILGAILIPYANTYDISSLEILGVGLVAFILSCIGFGFAHWTLATQDLIEET